MIPSLELSHAERFHYHLALRNPLPTRPFYFKQCIKDCWQKTTWADSELDIQPAYDSEGWNRYITKGADIDWNNFHIA